MKAPAVDSTCSCHFYILLCHKFDVGLAECGRTAVYVPFDPIWTRIIRTALDEYTIPVALAATRVVRYQQGSDPGPHYA